MKVSLVPRVFSNEPGGVRRIVEELEARLPAYGVEIGEGLVHAHAATSGETVDVYTCHGMYPPPTTDWQRASNAMVKRNCVIAQVVTVPALWMVGMIAKSRRDVRVIPNAIEPSEFKAAKDRGYVLFGKRSSAGGVVEEGQRIALWIAEQMPDVKFIFLEELPDSKKLGNVQYIGMQPFDTMKKWVAGASAYLSTTLEIAPVQVLEAMASSVPVVSLDKGGTPEELGPLAQRQTRASPSELPDLIREAMKHRAEWGEEGRVQVARNHSWGVVLPQYVEAYEEAARLKERTWPVKASIVVTCYNLDKYIGPAIDSALAQDFDSFEVVVVDDASTDKSKAIINQYRKKIKIKRNRHNSGGAGPARNAGIAMASGEYIVCLDGDDTMAPDYLSKMTAAMGDPQVGLVYSNFHTTDGEKVGRTACADWDFAKLREHNLFGNCTMFRREAWERVGGYKNINPSWEDYEFWLAIGEAGYSGVRVPEPLWTYRVRGDGRNAESQTHTARLRALVNAYHPTYYHPMVSVIIPCYKHEQYVADAVRSVCKQTKHDWECIVVDDGSPGDVLGALAEFVDEPRVRYFRQENKGLAAARNAGIRMSRGVFILPLDADDMIAPDFLERTVKAMEPGAIVYTDIVMFDDKGNKNRHELPDYGFVAMLKRGMMFPTSLYHRELWQRVGGYPEHFNIGWEDYAFWIGAGIAGWKGKRLAGYHGFRYRLQPDGMRVRAEKQADVIRKQLAEQFAPVYERYRTELA